MKNGRILSKVSILAVLLIMSGSAFAQRGQRMQADRGKTAMQDGRIRMGMHDGRNRLDAVLDLSEEQKEEMVSLRANHQKDMRYQQNLLGEKNAKLRTLLSAPERDKTAIENTIDDISEMKGELMKKQIGNREEMKSILTPEQVKKLESLGFGNGMRQGLRGKGGQGRRGGINARIGRRDFHGRGLVNPTKDQ